MRDHRRKGLSKKAILRNVFLEYKEHTDVIRVCKYILRCIKRAFEDDTITLQEFYDLKNIVITATNIMKSVGCDDNGKCVAAYYFLEYAINKERGLKAKGEKL